MTTKTTSPFLSNKNEILYNIINSLIAGGLVFIGTFLDGEVTLKGALVALMAALLVCITKFKDYWATQKGEYCKPNLLLKFI